MKTIQERVQEATGATGTLLTLSLVGIKEIEAFAKLVREEAQPKKEPAPGYCKHCKQYSIDEPLPPQPLTDEEIESIIVEMNGNEPTAPFWRDLSRAIEAAHGITAATQLKE